MLLLAIFALNTSCENDGGDSVIDLQNGALSNLTRVDGSAEFIVNTTFASLNLEFNIDLVYGDPISYDLRALYKTLDGNIYGPVTIDAGVNTFAKDYVISGAEIINAFPEISTGLDMNAGDILFLFPAFTLKDGSVIETLNGSGDPNYYAPNFNQIDSYNYFIAYSVVCAPQPGVYRIDMHDSFGDGWQTDDPNGGSGIMLILDGVVTAEFGLCTPYIPNTYDCIDDPNNGSTTVTIPVGTEIAVWQFPGDAYGEIGFEIFGPNDELILASGFGEAVGGPLTVVLCAE